MTTIEHRPPQVISDHWTAALKYRAIGRTAEDFRAEADDPAWVAGHAYIDGVTPEQERALMLAIAGAIDALTAEGLTPVKCWYLGGLDQFLGPYPGTPEVTG